MVVSALARVVPVPVVLLVEALEPVPDRQAVSEVSLDNRPLDKALAFLESQDRAMSSAAVLLVEAAA